MVHLIRHLHESECLTCLKTSYFFFDFRALSSDSQSKLFLSSSLPFFLPSTVHKGERAHELHKARRWRATRWRFLHSLLRERLLIIWGGTPRIVQHRFLFHLLEDARRWLIKVNIRYSYSDFIRSVFSRTEISESVWGCPRVSKAHNLVKLCVFSLESNLLNET